MDKCKDCIHYSSGYSYKGNGFCILFGGYMKEDDNCEDFEEGGED